MTLFVHITDLHVSTPRDANAGQRSETADTLERVVDLVNRMAPAPDFLVASGDLTNRGDHESYLLVKEILGQLAIPVVLALGNHDRRPRFHNVFGDGPSDRPYFHEAVHAGLHVITLDTSVPGRVDGAICDAQFAFLTRSLAARAELPKLLVMHHPPRLDVNGLPWASLKMESSDRLARVLDGQNVIGILSGHIHINQVNHWHGIPVVIPIGQYSTVDLLERQDLRIVEGTGFGICIWRATGLSVSFVPLSPDAKELGRIARARLRTAR